MMAMTRATARECLFFYDGFKAIPEPTRNDGHA